MHNFQEMAKIAICYFLKYFKANVDLQNKSSIFLPRIYGRSSNTKIQGKRNCSFNITRRQNHPPPYFNILLNFLLLAFLSLFLISEIKSGAVYAQNTVVIQSSGQVKTVIDNNGNVSQQLIIKNPSGVDMIYNLNTKQWSVRSSMPTPNTEVIKLEGSNAYFAREYTPGVETRMYLIGPEGNPLPDSYFKDPKNLDKLLADIEKLQPDQQIEMYKLLIEKNPEEKGIYDDMAKKFGWNTTIKTTERAWLDSKNPEVLRRLAYYIRGPPRGDSWEDYVKYVSLAEKYFPNDMFIKGQFLSYYDATEQYDKLKEKAEEILKIDPDDIGAKYFLKKNKDKFRK